MHMLTRLCALWMRTLAWIQSILMAMLRGVVGGVIGAVIAGAIAGGFGFCIMDYPELRRSITEDFLGGAFWGGLYGIYFGILSGLFGGLCGAIIYNRKLNVCLGSVVGMLLSYSWAIHNYPLGFNFPLGFSVIMTISGGVGGGVGAWFGGLRLWSVNQ